MANIVVCFRTQSLSVEEVSHPSNFSVLPFLDERSHIAATYLFRSIARSLNQPNPWHYLVSLRRRLHIWLSLDRFPWLKYARLLNCPRYPEVFGPSPPRNTHLVDRALRLPASYRIIRRQQDFTHYYICTRGTRRGTLYYMLPVLFKYASCSLYMNMVDEHKKELVKPASMANLLACTSRGGDKPYHRYGGWGPMTRSSFRYMLDDHRRCHRRL